MARMFAVAGVFAYIALMVSLFVQAAPTRRQAGSFECQVDRAQIVFHVAELATNVGTLVNSTSGANSTNLVAANNTVEVDLQALQDGSAGASAGIQQIILALVNGDAVGVDLRDSVGGNLTQVGQALGDLSSDDAATSALLAATTVSLLNCVLAGDEVVVNC